MGFKPGHKKNGGRQKGTPNKRTLDLIERARALKCDPFDVLLRFAKGDWKGLGYESETRTCFTAAGIEFEEPIIKPEHRLKAAAEAAQYLYPKRKSIEVERENDADDDSRSIYETNLSQPAKDPQA